MPKWRVIPGDCVEVMRDLDENSVDAIVTDPPYGLEFMGKEWDRLGAIVEHPDDGEGPWGRTNRVRFGATVRSMQAWHTAWATEALRVLKPGGHLLAFGGTRTYHRLTCALEDAGFEVRDCLAWLYGSGFPKSLDVSKAIDKRDAAAERDDRARRSQAWLREHITPQQINDATGTDMGHHLTTHPTQPFVPTPAMLNVLRPLLPAVPGWFEEIVRDRAVESANMAAREVVGRRAVPVRPGFAGERYTEPGEVEHADTLAFTDDARTWQGWGTALKPAFEPIVLARKPLSERNVAANVLRWSTGALNVDGCRIDSGDEAVPVFDNLGRDSHGIYGDGLQGSKQVGQVKGYGRWPANVTLDEDAAAMLDEQTGDVSYNPAGEFGVTKRDGGNIYGGGKGIPKAGLGVYGYGDTGGASRFFYTSKAGSAERSRGVAEYLPDKEPAKVHPPSGDGRVWDIPGSKSTARRNNHPTVKPVDLMQWLVRLVTPPGGTVLDPFTGSGSTGIAALREGFDFIGVEREPEYVEIARSRIIGDAPMFNVESEVVGA